MQTSVSSRVRKHLLWGNATFELTPLFVNRSKKELTALSLKGTARVCTNPYIPADQWQ